MFNYNYNNKYILTMHHNIPIRVLSMIKKPPVEDNKIGIVGTRPAISRNISPIVKKI